MGEILGASVARCMLMTAPNPMAGARPFALLETVVTHADHLRQGHGRAVMTAAQAYAWSLGARQVYLLTSKSDPGVHVLYRSCGFRQGRKAGYGAAAPA